jgi:predicted site-specific integrase-resolvase
LKLRDYAKKIGVCYQTAWNYYKSGQIPGAYQLPTGTIIVPDVHTDATLVQGAVVYTRVSSSENKANLKTQTERVSAFCAANGWPVKAVYEECASGLNDNRPKLAALFSKEKNTRVVVEHKDRLTRFGFNYLKMLAESKNIEIIVINSSVTDQQDLVQDFVSLVTSFSARLYGQRRSRRKTEELIKKLQEESE